MSVLVNLRSQVQKTLRRVNGGTGNRAGWSHGVIKVGINRTGSSIPRGTLVRLLATYNDARITPTTATDETTVLGILVGFIDPDDPETLIEADAPASTRQVAILVQGTTSVRLGGTATRGQFAYAHATDGTAYSSATAGPGAFGILQSSGTAGNTAIVVLWGAVGVGATVSFATPAIGLGTAPAAGSASTVIRSDATILAFDASAPTTIGFGDAAATGSAAVAARRDHRHGMAPIPALDDLADVGATAPASGDHLVFDGAWWAALAPVDEPSIWRPLMDGHGNVVVDGMTGEAIMAFGPQ